MRAQEILSLFKSYNLIGEDDFSSALEFYEDDDPTFIFEVINEYLEDHVLWYSIADGGWDEGIVDDFYDNVQELVKLSQGKIEVELLKLTPAKASDGVVEEDAEMEISFKHKDDVYTWSFTRNNHDLFLEEFTKWASKSLNGDYLFICEDHPIGYLLPKGFIKEIENYGVTSDMDMFDDEEEYDEKYVYEEPEFEVIGPNLDDEILEKLRSQIDITEGGDIEALQKYLVSYNNIANELLELDKKFESGEEMEAGLGDDFIALFESHGKTLVDEGMGVYFCEYYKRNLSGIKDESNLGTLIKRFEEAFYLTTTLLALFEEEVNSDFLHEAINSQEDFFVWKDFIVTMVEVA
jgi:hypothetical protein